MKIKWKIILNTVVAVVLLIVIVGTLAVIDFVAHWWFISTAADVFGVAINAAPIVTAWAAWLMLRVWYLAIYRFIKEDK